MFMSSQQGWTHAFITNTHVQWQMFLLVSSRHVGAAFMDTKTWRLDTKLYYFGKFISPNILHMKNCTDLNLGEGLWVYLAPFISYIPGFVC